MPIFLLEGVQCLLPGRCSSPIDIILVVANQNRLTILFIFENEAELFSNGLYSSMKHQVTRKLVVDYKQVLVIFKHYSKVTIVVV